MESKIYSVFTKFRNYWSTILFISVVFAAFVLPLLPEIWHKLIFKIVYTIIYISAIYSLHNHSNKLILVLISILVLMWVSDFFNFDSIQIISRSANILFFAYIIIMLIKQIATAKDVSAWVILESIVGYLLLGIIFSILIALILQYDPAAYSHMQLSSGNSEQNINVSLPIYYTLVTQASLGYGDIVPLKPYTRSLATFIAVSGQFYVTIIVALLVGKYIGRQDKNAR